MGSVHEELYARVKALFDQDLDAARGLNAPGSAAYCRGGIWRMGDPKRTQNWPYIEVRIAIDEDLHSKNGTICLCSIELRIVGNRDQNYQGNSGDVALNTVALRVREVYNDCGEEKGVNPNLYRISPFRRMSGSLGEVGDKDFVLVDRYQAVVSDRDVFVFQIYTGGTKKFYRGGFAREDRRFIALNIGDNEAPPDPIPHVGYTDRLSIVRAVTRRRLLNKNDCEYIVEYNPLDFSFDRRQGRISLEQSTIEQVVPLWKRESLVTPEGTFVWYNPQFDTFKRATFTRTEQYKKDIGKQVDGDILISIQSQIAADTNTIRLIDGKKYLFLGAKLTYNTNTGIALITAHFFTTGPVRARPPQSAGGVIYDVGLPALDYLDDYVWTDPIPSAAGGTSLPVIGKRTMSDICTVGVFAWLN